MLAKSSSESICLSEASVCGVAGSAASTSTPSLWCSVLLAFRCGSDLAAAVVRASAAVVISSFLLRVDGDVVGDAAVASPMTKQPALKTRA